MSSLSQFKNLLKLKKNQHHFTKFSFFIYPHNYIILSFNLKNHHHFNYIFLYPHNIIFISSIYPIKKKKKIYYKSNILLI